MAKRKTKKKSWFKENIFNFVWLVLIIIIFGGVYYGYTNNLIAFRWEDRASPEQQEFLDTTPTADCRLTISPSSIDFGDLVTGTIWTKNPTTFCEIFAREKTDDTWLKIAEGTTNLDGNLVSSENIYVAGDFVFAGLCEGCRTNDDDLHVNPEITGTCTDSDGKDEYRPGWLTIDGTITAYDNCAGSWAVTEYFCDGDLEDSVVIACDPGYICTETRSGDYCMLIVHDGLELGDVLGEGGYSYYPVVPGELKSYEITLDTEPGNNPICAEIEVEGILSVPACIPGMPVVKFNFYDSSGLAWGSSQVVDFSNYGNPQVVPVTYDGQTPFRMEVRNDGFCNVNARSNVKLVVCE